MIRSLLVSVCLIAACGGTNNNAPKYQCADGKDNDGDGKIDFPDDDGCTSAEDNSEDSAAMPQCSDGRDNDGDGKVDFPEDPGCFAPQQDDETDDCPDGPGCPECSNGKDDDGNGQMDYPNDTGCMAASDTDEYTENPAACGSNVHIKRLPFDGHATGMLNAGASNLMSTTCGGAGTEDVYELRVRVPKVIVATTNSDLTTADTVLYIRPADCQNATAEMSCNDDSAMGIKSSNLTQAISTPGTYYLVVDGKDTSTSGMYDLNVKFFVGEGTACQGQDDCGPGLVCRVPFGGTTKVCSKHVCDDNVDDDGDGKKDYPTDPGCSSPDDDDESDTCPNGPGCPECGDGRDNDGDGKTDYPMDMQCQSASSTSEACQVHEAVQSITTAMTMGDTTSATDDAKPACGSSSSTSPDLTYRLDLPQLTTLSINLDAQFDSVTALYNSTCGGTAVSCSDPLNMSLTNVAAGTYYFVVDGYFTGESGPFTINVSGTLPNGAACENALVQSGALTCGAGYACKGTVGSRTCQPALCGDGIDNDGDGKIDYPNDPGCDSVADDTEADPATPPVCANHTDDDGDGQSDWPADYGCAAASGTSEAFCTGEMDPTALVTTKTTTGTTTGKANDQKPTACSLSSSSNAPDVVYALQLPVPVASLQIDTENSTFDTMLFLRNTQCTGNDIVCDDDGGNTPSNSSLITLSNVAAGGYAIVIDGYSTYNGAYTLNVHGTVATGTRCDSPLFTGGANAVLSCPTGTTCTGTPAKCQ